MAIVRGTDGLIQVSATLIAATPSWITIGVQQTWTWEETNETIDVTVLGAQRARAQMTTFIGFNATSEGFWDSAADAGQVIVDAGSLSGDPIGVRIYPNMGTPPTPSAGDAYYEGDAYVNDTSYTGGYDNAVALSLSFAGTGLPVHDTET
jgi:predicted secreted protein